MGSPMIEEIKPMLFCLINTNRNKTQHFFLKQAAAKYRGGLDGIRFDMKPVIGYGF